VAAVARLLSPGAAVSPRPAAACSARAQAVVPVEWGGCGSGIACGVARPACSSKSAYVLYTGHGRENMVGRYKVAACWRCGRAWHLKRRSARLGGRVAAGGEGERQRGRSAQVSLVTPHAIGRYVIRLAAAWWR